MLLLYLLDKYGFKGMLIRWAIFTLILLNIMAFAIIMMFILL